jgi:hypothetical protein
VLDPDHDLRFRGSTEHPLGPESEGDQGDETAEEKGPHRGETMADSLRLRTPKVNRRF